MTLSNLDRRKARRGQGLLPPNPKHWENEHNGLDLRADLGIATSVRLPVPDAFGLLHQVRVIPHGELLAAQAVIEYFRKQGKTSWSGLALHVDGWELVLYNDSHPQSRIRATLMEEFFHLRLGHPRSVLRLLSSSESSRSHDGAIELEAYCSGAAALLPYPALKAMLDDGVPVASIAAQFAVSRDLVQFRQEICRLYRRAS